MVQVPQFNRLLWATLRALKNMGGSGNLDEIVTKVIELEAIPEDVQKVPHTNGRTSELEYRLAWARSILKTVGALENSARGVWAITPKGENLNQSDVTDIPRQARKIREQTKPITVSPRPKEHNLSDAAEIRNLEWKDQLLSVLHKLRSDAFERLAQRLLREAGFTKIEVTGRSGDGGIDGLGVLRVNLLSFQVLFQCKKYRGSVGPGAIRDFRGAMVGRSDKGLLITTGTFTAEARREATRDGAPAIDLIDGEQLSELLKNFKLGVTTELVEEITINAAWFDTI